ncbi:MAG: hypothetical protein KJ002_09480 [Candidatus Dadabacteria bacterium]|nr:hypothetical protein [Candidatus Dadabacteria bacterium]
MKSEDTIRTALEEWEKIRMSLSEIGDIGNLELQPEIQFRQARGYNGIYLVNSLNRFSAEFPEKGYFTPEAAYVYVNLVGYAGARLGLEDNFAESFGSGYSWVRTGLFDVYYAGDHRSIIKQLLFFQTFYPVEGDFHWTFESAEVKDRLKRVFSAFLLWQENPAEYVKGLRSFSDKLEPLRRGLSRALGVPILERTRSSGLKYTKYAQPESGLSGGERFRPR